jgi:hypothetical protein
MSLLHVVPDGRGNWRLYDDARSAPLSVHGTATDAEVQAWSCVGARGDEAIVVHDRYGRTRPAVHYDVEERETIMGLA